VIDRSHTKPLRRDTRTGRECQFCCRLDPQFANRHPMDKLVGSTLQDTASAHLTEDGYVKHRMVELNVRLGLPDLSVTPNAA